MSSGVNAGGQILPPMTPAEIAQRQLEAYNVQDLDAFCACYADDVVVADLNGQTTSTGIAAFRARYADTFSKFPQNKVRLVNRIAVGDHVMDHEDVSRTPQGPRFEVVAIYNHAQRQDRPRRFRQIDRLRDDHSSNGFNPSGIAVRASTIIRLLAASAVLLHHSLFLQYDAVQVDIIHQFSRGFIHLGFGAVAVFFVHQRLPGDPGARAQR